MEPRSKVVAFLMKKLPPLIYKMLSGKKNIRQEATSTTQPSKRASGEMHEEKGPGQNCQPYYEEPYCSFAYKGHH